VVVSVSNGIICSATPYDSISLFVVFIYYTKEMDASFAARRPAEEEILKMLVQLLWQFKFADFLCIHAHTQE